MWILLELNIPSDLDRGELSVPPEGCQTAAFPANTGFSREHLLKQNADCCSNVATTRYFMTYTAVYQGAMTRSFIWVSMERPLWRQNPFVT